MVTPTVPCTAYTQPISSIGVLTPIYTTCGMSVSTTNYMHAQSTSLDAMSTTPPDGMDSDPSSHFSSEMQHNAITVEVQEVPEERERITVRRKFIWADTKRALNRPNFIQNIGLIIFIGEPGQDAGGPLREYFRLLWESLRSDGNLFCGKEEARIPTHNAVAWQNGDYRVIGRCIALALAYGGTAPHFLSQAVVNYLLEEPLQSAIIQDIPDEHVKSMIQQVRPYYILS